MFGFAWPLAFAALPLPLLAQILRPAQRPGGALRVPFLAAVEQAETTGRSRRWLAALLIWLALVTAAARPQWVGEPQAVTPSGRDLMLAVDISGSMRTDDMLLDDLRSTRLQTVQALAGEFIRRRQGDRLGLILFGSRAYLQAPLTFDRETVEVLLNEAEIGLAGKETAIGDAIGLAVKRLRGTTQQTVDPHQVLILLTDGSDNASSVAPLQATELARQFGLTIYTIGVGSTDQLVRSIFGATRVNPSADLDEALLQRIATATGGRYFRARDSAELAAIYRLLDELEPAAGDRQPYRPVGELYPWPLGLALLLSASLALAAAAPARRPLR